MKRNLAARFLRIRALPQIALLVVACAALAQNAKPAAPTHAPAAQPAKATVPALLVSDIHFEPFWNPAKAAQLAAAPVSEWKAILAAAPSPDQPQRFAALQQSCHARGVDTNFALYQSSLKAMRAHAANAGFVAVSGDLISHAFECKYNTLFPHSVPIGYAKFVEKTLDYVIDELYADFPGTPVFVALGNNDSGCGDYRLDANSAFFKDAGEEVTKNFSAAERVSAQASFASGGYYSVSLPAPIEHTRLLVLDDTFMSSNYTTCAGKPDQTESAAQLAWLAQQLADARANQQKIWVMGHIPPGVDLHASVKKMANLCEGQEPAMFLSSEKMADLLVDFSDVVQLAIFAHTHMDELRLLKTDGPAPATQKLVAVKMVSSISPINGNNPSFTIAQIDPSSAALVDYKVFAASNATGVDTTWTEEYDFARGYHKADFASSSVAQLVKGFAADPNAKTQASQEYIRNFSAGNPSPLLQMFWPQYVCALANDRAQAFRACACPIAH
jgi:sphingomyelin phosphodiesterase acid-like 3